MKKKISAREIVLLIFLVVLVVGVSYYKFLYQPLTAKISAKESECASEQSIVNRYVAASAKMDKMQAAVDEAKGSGQGNPIPEYNNSTELMKELYEILEPTEQYTLTFSSVNTSEGSYIVDRPVQLTFQTRSYESMRTVLNNIEGSKFVNQISDLSINFPTAYNSNDELCGVIDYNDDTWFGDNVQVSLNVTFYELLDD